MAKRPTGGGLSKLVDHVNMREAETRMMAFIAAAMPMYGRDYTFEINHKDKDNPVMLKAFNPWGAQFIKHIQQVIKSSKPLLEDQYDQRTKFIQAKRGTNKNMDGQSPVVGGPGRMGARDIDGD